MEFAYLMAFECYLQFLKESVYSMESAYYLRFSKQSECSKVFECYLQFLRESVY
jgi:hypothetical protein